MKKSVQWNELNLLSKAIYASEQVFVRWHRTGIYYAAKLTFSHCSSIKVWGVYYIQIFMILSFACGWN